MTMAHPGRDRRAQDVGWLLDRFVDGVPDITHVLAISGDGLVIAASRHLGPDRVDQLAAAGSGLVSLLSGAAGFLGAGPVIYNVTQMHGGYLFVMSVDDRNTAAVLVLAQPDCDVGKVGHELAQLIERVGQVLAPPPRSEYGTAGR